MPVHPQAQAVLDVMAASGFVLQGDPQAVRDFMALAPRPEGEPVKRVEDRVFPGPSGDVPVRIYWPDAEGPRPLLVWYHGGGWVIGNLDGADYGCRIMTNAASAVVVSVDYRLAPEAKFPSAPEECYAALQWAVANAAELGADAGRVAVGGDSAGGNLAAVVSLMARDRKGPKVGLQLLVYPVTDYDFETQSYNDNAEGYLLTKDSMVWFWGHYVHTPEEARHPHASPLQAEDLTGLPPALVITAEYDPLRDEGEAYAKRLTEAGVKVTAKRFDGQIHGFFANPAIDDGREAALMAAGAIKQTLT
ncbi:MAG TPA: alpha/beta hydrolase [Tepidiformaceae bacterium]|nr:alpha/beta hydrolase [Tepidiformaceae bacterium]